MKKIFAIASIIFFCLSINTAYADTVNNLRSECYNEAGKIRLFPSWYETKATVINAELPINERTIPKLEFLGMDGNFVTGTATYPNYDQITVGNFDLQWVFTPNDDKYETRSGVFHFYFWPPDSEASKGKMPDPVDEVITPSLTASSVQLETMTAYDINLDNKISGSSYKWTSSDTSIAEVDPRSGLVKAKGEGKTSIICEITLPDSSTQTLISEIAVGYDPNAPLLTETSLDLEPGDTFDINPENKIAKSKYRWVSSDRAVVKVNSSTGKVTASGAGSAYVTCTITTPDKQVIVLRCDISVTE